MTYLNILTNRLKTILHQVDKANKVSIKHNKEIPSVFILLYEDLQSKEIEVIKFPINTKDDESKQISLDGLLLTLKSLKSQIRPLALITILNAWYVERDIKELEKENKDVKDIKPSQESDKKSCIITSCEINNQLITLMKREGEEKLIEVVDNFNPRQVYGVFQFVLQQLND